MVRFDYTSQKHSVGETVNDLKEKISFGFRFDYASQKHSVGETKNNLKEKYSFGFRFDN